MSRIRENKSLLYSLQSAKPKLFKSIIENSNRELILAICEIIFNILQGNVQLNTHVRDKLKRYKKTLRCIACPKQSISSKRRLLIQKGGGAFLPIIIGSVLSGLISSFSDKLLNKNNNETAK